MPFIYSGAAEEFGWTRGAVTLLASFKYLTGAVSGLIIGRLIDVFSPRIIVVLGAIIGGLAMLGFWFSTSLGVYYFMGIALGFSASGITVSMKVIVSSVFERGQGTAVGIVLTGTSIGGIIVPIVVAPLIEKFGWRQAMALLSLGIWFIAIPAWLLSYRDSFAGTDRQDKKRSPGRPGSGLRQHLKLLAADRNFWLLAGGVFLVGAVDMGMLQNQVLYLERDRGLDLSAVAWATSLLAAIGVVSKVGFGWFYDRFSIRGIMICYIMLALSILLAFPVAGITSMIIFMVARGIAHGGIIVDVPVLTRHYYGLDNIGLNMGILSAFLQMGMAAGPPLLGYTYDYFGSYNTGFSIIVVCGLLAALMLLPVKPRFWKPPEKGRAEEHGQAGVSSNLTSQPLQ